MENAIKAIYIAAGMLLGVMILSVLVYVFTSFSSIGKNYEIDTNTQRIVAFNSQFDKYAGITKQSNKKDDGYCFKEKSNIISDVITCANLAYNINRKNEYDEINHVEVAVRIDDENIYYLYPYETQPQNCFFINVNREQAKINNFDAKTQTISFYNFLQKYSNIKIVNINSKNYKSRGETIYEYYFDVNFDETGKSSTAGKGIHYSEVTGKVDKIVFTAVKTIMFDNESNETWTNL